MSKRYARVIWWIKRDIRAEDNQALACMRRFTATGWHNFRICKPPKQLTDNDPECTFVQ